jgi:anti-sigma B factor antagonist
VHRDAIPLVVSLSGEIDVDTAGELRGTLEELSSPDQDIVLDMNGVEFMDSSGLGLLLAMRKRGRFSLRGLSDRAMRLFQLTGLYEVLDIEEPPDQS